MAAMNAEVSSEVPEDIEVGKKGQSRAQPPIDIFGLYSKKF